MIRSASTVPVEHDAPIPTWIGVGGRADTLARPSTSAQLAECLAADPALRVLGDGANLIVDDAGVRELVVSLRQGEFTEADLDAATGLVRVGAGFDLAKLIHATVRTGLVGLEGLIGVPATIGGALRMNAGGTHGDIARSVRRVHGLQRDGRPVTLEREDIAFGYRTSGLEGLIVTAAELALRPGDPDAARAELKKIMRHKSDSQPLKAATCGCVFRNPTLADDLDGVGVAGDRVSAGLLIDRAGGKGLAAGGCRVSQRHANFVETAADASTADVLRLIDRVRTLVRGRFGVGLQTELVVWRSAR